MKVILTGAKGQLGSDIIRTKPDFAEISAFEKASLDITDRDQTLYIMREKRPDVVINTAAYVRVDDAEDNFIEAFKINATGVKNLVDACRQTGAIVLHISTDYVFDGGKAPIPYNEQDVPNPLNVYGISKFASELFVRNYLVNAYVVRTASLYGKSGASGKGGNFVFTVLDKLRNKQTMKVVNDIYMSPTCTYDLAQEIWRLLADKMPYGTYHIANAGYCSWHEFAETISSLSGLNGDIIAVSHYEYPSKAKRPLWSPLTSIKGIKMAPWQKSLEVFLSENMRVSLNEK